VLPLGLKPKFAPHCFEEYGYLAGTDQRTPLASFSIFADILLQCLANEPAPNPERADDVMAMFKDPSVKMIVANRGGWGCNRFIDMVRLTFWGRLIGSIDNRYLVWCVVGL
jgi:muramoyltetrapeptide carboxypeptidase